MTTASIPDLSQYPGGDLVMQGVADLRAGIEDSVAALLVRIGEPRLALSGIDIPARSSSATGAHPDAEIRLYGRLVSEGHPDAFSTYRSLIRRLISCEAALELSKGRILRRARERGP